MFHHLCSTFRQGLDAAQVFCRNFLQRLRYQMRQSWPLGFCDNSQQQYLPVRHGIALHCPAPHSDCSALPRSRLCGGFDSPAGPWLWAESGGPPRCSNRKTSWVPGPGCSRFAAAWPGSRPACCRLPTAGSPCRGRSCGIDKLHGFSHKSAKPFGEAVSIGQAELQRCQVKTTLWFQLLPAAHVTDPGPGSWRSLLPARGDDGFGRRSAYMLPAAEPAARCAVLTLMYWLPTVSELPASCRCVRGCLLAAARPTVVQESSAFDLEPFGS